MITHRPPTNASRYEREPLRNLVPRPGVFVAMTEILVSTRRSPRMHMHYIMCIILLPVTVVVTISLNVAAPKKLSVRDPRLCPFGFRCVRKFLQAQIENPIFLMEVAK